MSKTNKEIIESISFGNSKHELGIIYLEDGSMVPIKEWLLNVLELKDQQHEQKMIEEVRRIPVQSKEWIRQYKRERLNQLKP